MYLVVWLLLSLSLADRSFEIMKMKNNKCLEQQNGLEVGLIWVR